MVQFDLNLMLARTLPAFKITHIACTHVFFANLHANKNPLHVTRQHIVQARASLGTRYTPASTSGTQVTRVHASSKSYTQVCSRLSAGAPWYLHGTAIIGLTTCYKLSHVLLASSLFWKRSRHHESGY